MKDQDYIVVQGWMLNKLQLKGTRLMVFAIIYSFSRDGENSFFGTLKYLEDCTGNSRRAVIDALNCLVELEYILKQSETINGVTFNRYRANLPFIQTLCTGSAEIAPEGSAEFAPEGVQKLHEGSAEIAPIISNRINNSDKNLFTARNAEKFFRNQGIGSKPFLDVLAKTYGYSMEIILTEFAKWRDLNEDEYFESERHLKNSFARWIKEYKPINPRTEKVTNSEPRGGNALNEILKELRT